MSSTLLTFHVPIGPLNLGSSLQLVPAHEQSPVGSSVTHLTTAA